MNNTSMLFLVLSLVAAGCGDAGAPTVPGRLPGSAGCGGHGGAGGEGGAGGQAGAGGEGGAGGCWVDDDCGAVEEVCIPTEFDGIPGEVTDVPGACVALPPEQELQVITFTPIRFTDEEGVRDPETDAYDEEEGIFEITNSSASFRTMYGPIAWGAWNLPYRSPTSVVPFHWQAEFSLRVVGIPGEPTETYDIKCYLVFGPDGQLLEGGVVREPGKLLCSEYNWSPPESPNAAGLVIEYEVVEVAVP